MFTTKVAIRKMEAWYIHALARLLPAIKGSRLDLAILIAIFQPARSFHSAMREIDKDRGSDFIADLERCLTKNNTPVKSTAICAALKGLAYMANYHRLYEDALRIHDNASSLLEQHDKCCQDLAYWATMRVFPLALTGERPEAEEVLRQFAPKKDTTDLAFELLFELKKSQHFAVVASMWLQT
ncbi:hypothetical protein B0T16DRAFT_458256 [Cercophora newfieldiana]|uniref:Uncharacterized protein n=1 Tax=Cercophora newfieldiana TaxID=92897 RepID=A0AA40CPC4_9PEZI|nr:hypothetical protein B0T16DRAFT_458256 [Cercophora newfieldiana]